MSTSFYDVVVDILRSVHSQLVQEALLQRGDIPFINIDKHQSVDYECVIANHASNKNNIFYVMLQGHNIKCVWSPPFENAETVIYLNPADPDTLSQLQDAFRDWVEGRQPGVKPKLILDVW
jgi:hypothetical protein